jgi:hypothetical protein
MKRVLFLACALACSSAAFGQLYKSIDKDGRVIYSDQPPPAMESKQLRVNPGPPPPAPAAQKALEKEPDKGRVSAQEKAKADEEAANRAKIEEDNCNRAKIYLRTVADGGRLSSVDAKGERVLLDDKQIEEERIRAQKLVDESCKAK